MKILDSIKKVFAFSKIPDKNMLAAKQSMDRIYMAFATLDQKSLALQEKYPEQYSKVCDKTMKTVEGYEKERGKVYNNYQKTKEKAEGMSEIDLKRNIKCTNDIVKKNAYANELKDRKKN